MTGAAGVVYLKELKDALRDRRTLLMVVLISLGCCGAGVAGCWADAVTSRTAATMIMESPSRQVAITMAELADSRISGAAKDMPISDAASTSTGERRDRVDSRGEDEAGIAAGRGTGLTRPVTKLIGPTSFPAMTPTISRARLEALLADAASQHVVIIGDAMLDVYLRGDVDRISPEAPVPVVRVRDRKEYQDLQVWLGSWQRPCW